MKANVRHVGILFWVGIFTFASPSGCHSASAYQISSKSNHPRQSYDVISIFQERPRHRNFISGFGFRDFAHLGKSTCTCIPNFGEISQSTAAIWLLPVSENNRPWCWNSTCTFGFDFHICVTIGMSFCICLPNFVQIGPSATYSYDVISINIQPY